MEKPYTISFDEKELKELNTALRIMHNRRDNQYKYVACNKKSDKPPNRKTKKYLTINKDDKSKLDFIVSDYIPVRKNKIQVSEPTLL
jgi:hypothetical protein